MAKKLLWGAGIIIVALVIVYLILLRLAPNVIPADIPLLGKLTCPYPVSIAGNSMAPALPAGTRVTFDRCARDKSNLSAGTLVAFQENGTVRISRIIEKTEETPNVIYKTAQDGKPGTFIHVPASDIIATYIK